MINLLSGRSQCSINIKDIFVIHFFGYSLDIFLAFFFPFLSCHQTNSLARLIFKASLKGFFLGSLSFIFYTSLCSAPNLLDLIAFDPHSLLDQIYHILLSFIHCIMHLIPMPETIFRSFSNSSRWRLLLVYCFVFFSPIGVIIKWCCHYPYVKVFAFDLGLTLWVFTLWFECSQFNIFRFT